MVKQRYRHILWFFARVIFAFIWWDIILPKIGFKKLSRKTRTTRLQSIARSFRAEAVRLGGVLIKVGQFLSARLDVLPRAITDELAGLQDEVAPESFENIRLVIENEFGEKLENKFKDFQTTPLASASIGQVHLARLIDQNGTGEGLCPQVAVKIQRHQIHEIVETDLSALRVVAGWIMRYNVIRKRADIPALLEEFSVSIHEELDYIHEGKNAERFGDHFKERLDIVVPKVVWSHTTGRVLSLEYLQAIKITDYSAIEIAGISRVEVAARLFDTYLKQIFEDHFFHADPHPGNLFVKLGLEGNPREWELVFVDFGMAGDVPDHLLRNLRDILIALATQDAGRIVKAYQNLGVLLPGADIGLLEKATAKVFDRFWGKTAPEMMRMHHSEAVAFVAEFGDLIYEMPFQVPENMILLVRCLGILSGMCTGLDVNFNVWTSLMPYAQKLVESESGGKLDLILKEIERFVTALVSLPTKTESLLKKIEQGKLVVRNPDLESAITQLDFRVKKLTEVIVLVVIIWASIEMIVNQMPIPGIVIGSVGGLVLVWILFGK